MTDAQASSRQPTVMGPILGVVLILCGLFALLAPLVSTIATTLIVAIAIGASGIAQVIQAFRSPEWKGFLLNLFLGLVFIAGAVAIFARPFSGAIALTLLLAWILLIAGGGEVVLGFKIRPQKGWFWLILSGIVAIAVSIWLFLRIPFAGVFVPGVALGVALIFEGWAFIIVGVSGGVPAQPEMQPAGAE